MNAIIESLSTNMSFEIELNIRKQTFLTKTWKNVLVSIQKMKFGNSVNAEGTWKCLRLRWFLCHRNVLLYGFFAYYSAPPNLKPHKRMIDEPKSKIRPGERGNFLDRSTSRGVEIFNLVMFFIRKWGSFS